MVAGQDRSPKRDGRLLELDALRGIAAILVVFFHFTAAYGYEFGWGDTQPLVRLTSGQAGVALFFVISGFVIAMTLERSESALDFVVSRFARLYPTFWFSALLTTSLIVATGFNPFHLTLQGFLASLTMANGLTDIPFIDPAYWTLTREILFYAFFATAYFGVGPRHTTAVLLAWIIGTSFYNVFVSDTNFYACRTAASCGAIALNATFAHLFAAGALGYKLYRGERTPLVLVTLLAAILAGSVSFWPEHGFQPSASLKAALFVGVVVAAAGGLLKILQSRVLVFFGAISYSLYLLHQVIGYFLIGGLLQRGVNANLAILTAFCLLTALASAVCYGVERPSQRVIRRWYAAYRDRRRALPVPSA